MALIRIAGPAVEPISVDDMKVHLRVDFDDEDALIAQYISAARQKLEQRCARSFVQQTWELRAAEFAETIEVPKPPTVEISSVKYIDEDGVEQTVDSADYDLVHGGEFESSSLIWLTDRPTDLYQRADAARIQFVAGWAPDGVVDPVANPDDYVANVPWAIRQAILFLAGHLYENRESVLLAPVRQELQELPESVSAFIAPYIVPRL